jgi:hypothetical protein
LAILTERNRGIFLLLPILFVLGTTMITPNAFASHSVDPDACRNDGLYDGENNAFSQELYDFCGEYGEDYYDGFIQGCMSAGNDLDTCESATDG